MESDPDRAGCKSTWQKDIPKAASIFIAPHREDFSALVGIALLPALVFARRRLGRR
jgi:hypothetical protein